MKCKKSKLLREDTYLECKRSKQLCQQIMIVWLVYFQNFLSGSTIAMYALMIKNRLTADWHTHWLMLPSGSHTIKSLLYKAFQTCNNFILDWFIIYWIEIFILYSHKVPTYMVVNTRRRVRFTPIAASKYSSLK